MHLTAHNPPSFGVARVGPVYTPGAHRGHGYASATVAAVSRMLREAGAEVCLFTDQANPTSNKIYAAIGYRAGGRHGQPGRESHHTSTGLTTAPEAESAIAWLIWSNG